MRDFNGELIKPRPQCKHKWIAVDVPKNNRLNLRDYEECLYCPQLRMRF